MIFFFFTEFETDRYQMFREIRSRVMIPEQKIVQGSNKGKKEISRVKKRTSLLSLSLSL
jgi:hypothetical protein